MSTEQSTPQDSVEAAVSAMETKLFGAPEEEQESSQPEVVDEEETSEEEQTVEDEFVEFQTDEGETLRVPSKAKEYLERRSDYTRKTQEVAVLHEKALDRHQYLEAREKFSAAVIEDMANLRSLQSQLTQYQNADWQSIYDSSPGQALKLQQQMRELEKQIEQTKNGIDFKARQIGDAAQKHQEMQWQLAEKGAMQRIGTITAQENQLMAKQVQALGFTEREFKTLGADPRIIHAVYKAAKWDAMQSGKSEAIAKTANAPPVLKPGSSDPGMSAKMANLNWSKQMKNAKSPTEKAKLAEARMAKFFR